METNDTNHRPGGDLSSGENLSLWLTTAPGPVASTPLNQDIDTDVLVIGGGISGITTAYCLAQKGQDVVLIEDGYIGSGESGRTSGHLCSALDDRFYELERLFGKDGAVMAAESHAVAIEWIEHTIKKHNIDCHFRRVDGYLFLYPGDKKENLEKEYQAAKEAGLMPEMLNSIPFMASEEGSHCIRFPYQAQFHVMLYLKAMAKILDESGVRIFTQTRAEEITEKGAKANGHTIRANHIVVATNSPVNNLVSIHTKQWPYRSYVIAGKVPSGSLPYSLWWDSGDPYHYVRLEEYDGTHDMLIVGGEDHKTGQADDEDIPEEERYAKIETWARKRFPMLGDIEMRWSGQIMEPVDSLGYAGKNPGNDNIYVITGDSGNGLTNGTLGALIVRDLILDRQNPWTELYKPSRIPLKAGGTYLKEFGNMVAQYGDWFTAGDIKDTNQLKPCEGGIISFGLKKTAVYCDEKNKLHTFSAICPHLGGILHWNADEQSFDCPVHGSRFSFDGKIINGPASSDLEKIDINREKAKQ